MPNLPDIPGKGLIQGTTKGVRLLAVAVGAGAAAGCGFLLKRVLGHGEADHGADTDPIVETPSPPPALEAITILEPKVAEPALPPEAVKPRPAKPRFEPGNISGEKNPHRALNNPVVDPDPTEYPDPFEKRDDPRDPADPDGKPFGEEPHPPTGAESTSEPHPRDDLEAGDRAEPPRREKLDD
jgi:hypothetical protein